MILVLNIVRVSSMGDFFKGFLFVEIVTTSKFVTKIREEKLTFFIIAAISHSLSLRLSLDNFVVSCPIK